MTFIEIIFINTQQRTTGKLSHKCENDQSWNSFLPIFLLTMYFFYREKVLLNFDDDDDDDDDDTHYTSDKSLNAVVNKMKYIFSKTPKQFYEML